MDIETATLTVEEMGLRVEFPTGWTLEADERGTIVACIAEDEWEDDGYAASITIELQPPTMDDGDGYDPDEGDELDELAEASLREMSGSYRDFALLATERRGATIIRSYEFQLPELERRVRQVQGLVSDSALYVVNATAPLPFADRLEPLFEAVIRSVRRVDT